MDWVAGSHDASTAALHRCAHACVSARRHTRSTSNGFATKGREGGRAEQERWEGEQSLVMRMKRGDEEEAAYLDEDGREGLF